MGHYKGLARPPSSQQIKTTGPTAIQQQQQHKQVKECDETRLYPSQLTHHYLVHSHHARLSYDHHACLLCHHHTCLLHHHHACLLFLQRFLHHQHRDHHACLLRHHHQKQWPTLRPRSDVAACGCMAPQGGLARPWAENRSLPSHFASSAGGRRERVTPCESPARRHEATLLAEANRTMVRRHFRQHIPTCGAAASSEFGGKPRPRDRQAFNRDSLSHVMPWGLE